MTNLMTDTEIAKSITIDPCWSSSGSGDGLVSGFLIWTKGAPDPRRGELFVSDEEARALVDLLNEGLERDANRRSSRSAPARFMPPALLDTTMAHSVYRDQIAGLFVAQVLVGRVVSIEPPRTEQVTAFPAREPLTDQHFVPLAVMHLAAPPACVLCGDGWPGHDLTWPMTNEILAAIE